MNHRPYATEPLDTILQELFPRMREVRRHLHRFPEISGLEFETTQYLVDQLRNVGLEANLVANDRGIIVDSCRSHGPRIGIRADMDALPLMDEKDVGYASQRPGTMHACGHDAHAAIVLGTAMALTRAEREGILPWPVRWRAIFQPAEETNQGALEMVAAGATDGISALVTLHVDPVRPVGTIGIRPGPFTADCIELHIVIRGQGGHAARPHESRDAIAAAAHLVSAVYQFLPRNTDAQEPVVISFGQITGGHNANVIPDQVTLRGTLRTLHRDVSAAVLAHLQKLVNGIADASGTSVEIKTVAGPPPVHNDVQLTSLVESVATRLLGEGKVQPIERSSMGGEDFANYLDTVPGVMFRLGSCSDQFPPRPLHSPHFDIDEKGLMVGARVLAHTAVAWCEPRAE